MGSNRNTTSTTVVAFEGELNGIVKEYLDFSGLDQSLRVFEAETKSQGRPIEQPMKRPWNKRKADLQSDLLALFKSGARFEFFMIWDENVPENVRKDDPVCKKIEFYLSIYFAIFPIRYHMITGKKAKNKLEDTMEEFKKYLENRGASLSQTTEFLPFYALPFVPDPTKHPSYKELFQDNWVSDLQVRLEKFMAITLPAHPQPRLFELYNDMNSKNSEQLQKLQNAIVDAEKRNMVYVKRYNKIQADYHNLIGITAELVDSLESCIKGNQVTPEYVQSVCQRLFSNQLSESVDITRPATAAAVLKMSMQQHSTIPEEVRDDLPILATLDFKKVRADMVSAESRRRSLLLQALRWRLTRSEPGEQRGEVIAAFIKHDVLGCAHSGSHRDKVIEMLNSTADEVIQQYTARLFNAFASLSVGRNYLGKFPHIVETLQVTLQSEDQDSITRENALGALQKLSLKRHLQTLMIEGGIIIWLVSVLEDSDSLSDYTLEYSIALLMNLCLRTSGKRKCVDDKTRILHVLSDLLGHEDHEIRPYVNGTLYSILSIPEIREEAKAMGMEDVLKCFIKEDTPEMNRQIHFIIKQLNSDVVADDADSDDEDDEDEEDLDQDAMEADLDKAEVVKPQQGELSGEKLLMAYYMWDGKTASRSGSAQSQHSPARHSAANSRQPSATAARPVSAAEARPLSAALNGRMSRPPTSSGSRAGSAVANRGASAHGAGGDPTQQDLDSAPDPEDQVQAELPQGSPVRSAASGRAGGEYTQAFGSRPKIPRTPENGKRPVSRGMTPPPPVRSSGSPPPSRPTTGGSRQNGGLSPLSSVTLYISEDGLTSPTEGSGSRLASVKSYRSVVTPGDTALQHASAASRRQGSAGSSGRAR